MEVSDPVPAPRNVEVVAPASWAEGGAVKALPDGVFGCARTPEFSEGSIPGNLLKCHRTRAGTWGKIVVLEGRLCYRILEPEICAFELSPDNPGIVEPEVPHEVEASGRVRFYVEFYR